MVSIPHSYGSPFCGLRRRWDEHPRAEDRGEDEDRRRDPEADDVDQAGLVHVQLRWHRRTCSCGRRRRARSAGCSLVVGGSSRYRVGEARRPRIDSLAVCRRLSAAQPGRVDEDAQPVADQRMAAQQQRHRRVAAAAVSSRSHGVAIRPRIREVGGEALLGRRPGARLALPPCAAISTRVSRIDRVAQRATARRRALPGRAPRPSGPAATAAAGRARTRIPRSSTKARTRQAVSVSSSRSTAAGIAPGHHQLVRPVAEHLADPARPRHLEQRTAAGQAGHLQEPGHGAGWRTRAGQARRRGAAGRGRAACPRRSATRARSDRSRTANPRSPGSGPRRCPSGTREPVEGRSRPAVRSCRPAPAVRTVARPRRRHRR